MWLKSQHHILILKYKKCWKPSWSSEIILTNITFRTKGRRLRTSKLRMGHGRIHCKILLYGRINFTLTWPVKLDQQEKEYVNFIITGRPHFVRPLLTLQWRKFLAGSREAFCCACFVSFSLMRETAGMHLRRFSAQGSREKRSRKIRRKTTLDRVFGTAFL